jgi:glycosyltransferase involved in cell wall biosynthesis
MIRTMARALIQAGVDVDVATTDDNGPDRVNVSYSEPVVEEGVCYRYFPRQTRFYTFSWPLTRWLALHLREYDLLHIHGLFSYPAMPAAYFASRYKIPYIVRPFGVLNRWGIQNRRPLLKKLSLRLIENRILAGAAAVHYTSEQEHLEAAELGVTQRAVIIPNVADGAAASKGYSAGWLRSKHPQLADHKIILFLSRLDPKKGLDLLLPAFARGRAKCSQTKLVVVGNGDPAFIAGLRGQATRLGIDADVVWTGFLVGDEKWAALADADMFVLPSYSENFGISAVEAMISGLPVVVSDQVAIHREIAAAGAGLVVPCKVKELAEALIKLINNPQLSSLMGKNGKSLVQKEFSLESVTGRLIALYAEILSRPVLSRNAIVADLPSA